MFLERGPAWLSRFNRVLSHVVGSKRLQNAKHCGCARNQHEQCDWQRVEGRLSISRRDLPGRGPNPVVKPNYPDGEGQLGVHTWDLDDGVGGIGGNAGNTRDQCNNERRCRHAQISPASGGGSCIERLGVSRCNESANRNERADPQHVGENVDSDKESVDKHAAQVQPRGMRRKCLCENTGPACQFSA